MSGSSVMLPVTFNDGRPVPKWFGKARELGDQFGVIINLSRWKANGTTKNGLSTSL